MTISQRSPITLVAGEALEAYRLVYINSSGNAMYATANIRGTHYTLAAVASGARVACEALESGEVAKLTGGSALSVGGTAYGAASGKVSATSGGIAYGTVVDSGFADGDYVGVSIGTPGVFSLVRELTADTTLTAADSGGVFTNLGASGTITVSLPSAPPAGLRYTFSVATAQQLRIDPGNSDAFYWSGAKQTDGAYLWADDEGESITVVSLSTGDWLTVSPVGTWTAV